MTQDRPEDFIMLSSSGASPFTRKVAGLCVLGLLLPLSAHARNHTTLRIAPSSPDEPLVAGDPVTEANRLAVDQAYEALRTARVGHHELGRPFDAPALQSFGDPVLNLDSGLGYSSLQNAINAATAGDTLQVVADLDEGPVLVDRNLFVQGATGSETIRATQDTGTSGDARGWFLVDPGIALVVRDLAFDGNGFKIYQAFRHRGLGLFERTHFRDIQYEPSGPLYRGTAIVAFGDRVDILGSTFSEIGRVGVLYFGTSVTGAVFAGNHYTGKGDGDFLDYGVELNSGAGVWVLDNVLSDCRGMSMDGFASAGILATTASGPGTALVAMRNQLLANTFGLRTGAGAGDTTMASAALNRIVDNGFGITAGSDVAMVAENNWWACNDGPGAGGCDAAGVSDNGSIDANPWLVLQLDGAPWVKPNDFTTLTGRLTFNSDGVDTTPLGTVADGIPGAFAPGTLGTVVPGTANTVDGVMQSLFLAGGTEGSTQTTLTLDHQTVEHTITIELGLFCDGFESDDTSLWDSTVP